MKCIYCGAWTRVVETRGSDRQRECGNLHRFWTVESVKPGALAHRNRQMIKRVLAGESAASVARAFGLKAASVVSSMVKKAHPDFCARSNGTKHRWSSDAARSRRNTVIVQRVLAGETAAAVARDLGISGCVASRVVKASVRDFDARAHGYKHRMSPTRCSQ